MLVECPAEVAGGGDATLLLHATHLHAHVLGLYYYHHSLGMQSLLYRLADLLGQALLQLKAVAEHIHHTGYLAQSRNFAIGDVCHMNTSVEGKHVVFAERVEVDVLHYDHLVATFLMEDGALQYGHRILFVSSGQVGHGS